MDTPAEANLASTLLGVLNDDPSKSQKRKRLSTSCSVIDGALRGGIEHGRVTCISGEKGTGKTTVRDD
jgi:RecA/RadA recombinase